MTPVDMGGLIYFSNSALPSRFANGVHVMKMCAALGRSTPRVRLFARRASEPVASADGPDGLARARLAAAADSLGSEDLCDWYGVERSFKVDCLPRPRMPGRASLYAFWGAAKARWYQPAWVYGRYVRGCYLSAMLGLPVLFEAHSTIDHWQGLELALFKRLAASPRLLGLVVISEPLRAHYAALFPALSERLLVLPDAADPPGDAVPAALGDRRRLQVGYVGHLYPGRGIELVEGLAQCCPWADFHVVGGADADVAHWRRRAAEQDNLQVHGFVPPRDTDAFRLAFDVALAPYSRRTTIAGKLDTTAYMSPLKLFEYMASARAILCSDLPVLHEVMRHEHNCLLCPPEDVAGWAKALSRLRDEPSLRRRLGAGAGADFVAKHSWDARAQRVVARFAPAGAVSMPVRQ